MKYFPDEKEIIKLNRQFILNVLNTVIGESLRNFIFERIEERNRSKEYEQEKSEINRSN